ncbi:MAG: nudix-type nucleoside diphosphatase (YffH/AdpP family) [Candidatus Latescibacterota bacterium]|jgi:nudix-type nucleoside diphosphatase (YffH/AdpP family)
MEKIMGKIEILARRRLVDAFFKLDEAQLRHEQLDGSMSAPMHRLNLERGNGVAALIHRPQKNTLVLVRQFRYPTYLHDGPGWILEIAAGMLDENENPAETMRREIVEETGFAVKSIELLSHFYLTPGGSSERIFLYYAEVDEDLPRAEGGGLNEEHEDIEIVEISLDNAWQLLDSGQIVDAKTIIALQWLRTKSLPLEA